MSAGRKLDPLYTAENFLAYTRSTDRRMEYIDGRIRAMATEGGFHADISGNVYAVVHAQLKGKKCRARSKDSMVRSGPEPTPGRAMAGLYSLPDVVVICGEPEYIDDNRDIIVSDQDTIENLSR